MQQCNQLSHLARSPDRLLRLRQWSILAVGLSLLSCGRYRYEDKTGLGSTDGESRLDNEATLNSSFATDASSPRTLTADAGLPSNSSPALASLSGDAATAAVQPPDGGVLCDLGTYDDCAACGDSCATLTLPGASDYACVSGSCEMVSCLPQFEDCDGEADNGCEVDLSSLNNCGGCGLGCSILNAEATCNSGTCELLACNSGFGNCDADITGNGCERSLDTLTDCGGCGIPCTRPNGTATCATGTCALLSCNNGFDNCDTDQSTGCETPLDTLANCDACGTICDIVGAATSSCSGGACTAAVCSAGLADCDEDGTSCETDLSTLTDCVGCGVLCGDATGRLDNSTATCASGSCLVDQCDANFDDCDTVPGNGCETPLTTLSDCGVCGTGCGLDNAGESCASGICQITSCDTGFANCDNDPSTGCEAQLSTDAHCGGCNQTCSAVQACFTDDCIGSFKTFTPSNLDLPDLDPVSAPNVDLNCGGVVSFDTSSLSHNGWCGGPVPTVVVQEQTNGPDLVVITLQSLDVALNTTLLVTGSRPVAFAVFGDVTIAGTLDVSANGTTGGPGEDWQCNLSDSVNAPGGGSTTGGGGGGGGALGALGGRGGNGGNGTQGGASGEPRSSFALSPLLPGCRGGWGGGCGDKPGGGGGAVQLSVTGALAITGSIVSNGGNGLVGCPNAGGASGGGSGGAILLEANSISVSGAISAAGGNGGVGASGAAGGLGSTTGAGSPGTNSGTSGSGGGGSAGRIRILGAQSCSLGGTTLPAPSTSC